MTGLTNIQAEELLNKFGHNEITGRPRQTPFGIFLSQFASILVILLITASVASLFLGDLLDGMFILLIVILNGILGFVQEYKAEKTIAALKKMTLSSVRVIREGFEQMIDSKLLVPGDIFFLEEGDKIPADATLLESLHLEVNEASLTGESMAIEPKKDIFMGTIVTKGRAKALVTATGMQTRFGQIAVSLSAIKEDDTPLQKKLNTLGKQLGILAIFASGIVFVIGFFAKYPLIEMVLTSISLAVAAVPEGLPAVITITLAIGMQRMARQKAILRKLSPIEALGSTTIIATDKTGTLTKNEMRVTKIWLDGTSYSSHDKSLELYQENFGKLLTASV
ncbi:MAG: HAD-IC family P-type ATPase, partial [Candidatus Amesbacteria bacterium]|nr:HAD-IC family P-type ATPase [Candidatus Amesbacteria bacterium]